MAHSRMIELLTQDFEIELHGIFWYDDALHHVGYRVCMCEGECKKCRVEKYMTKEQLEVVEELASFELVRMDAKARFTVKNGQVICRVPIGMFPVRLTVSNRPSFDAPLDVESIEVTYAGDPTQTGIAHLLPKYTLDSAIAAAEEVVDNESGDFVPFANTDFEQF